MPTMKVTRFTDPQAFNEHIGVALAPRERENNLLLGIVRHLVEKRDDTAYMVAIAAETETVCVAVMTPPFNLVLSTGPTQAVEPLIDHLEAADVPVLGVISIATMADAFTSAWQRQAGSKIDLGTDMRLYALGTAPRVPPVPGGLEAAAIADVPLLVEWSNAFFAEANMTEAERDFFIARLEEMIARPRVWLWTLEGRPVCMVGHSETTPTTARIGPVYTPAPLRGRGYATAAVAELSRRLLAGGRTWCLLFADVANPTSTGIYRRLGYEEVCLFREYRFAA
ncbi:MAG TPA: GNAT family N-acetyltransferase [Methylomirabilota bacterium]|nr:GNAT family N-acetyltransferase [Methylomirabilota bacterium]